MGVESSQSPTTSEIYGNVNKINELGHKQESRGRSYSSKVKMLHNVTSE